jgi:Na+-translocating ferredoxin:NAD+ oxidoreductase RnfE subunit
MTIHDEQLKKEARVCLRVGFIAFNLTTIILFFNAWPWSAFLVFCFGVTFVLETYQSQIFTENQKIIHDEQLKKEARVYLTIIFIAFNLTAIILFFNAWPWSAYVVFGLGIGFILETYKYQKFDGS